MQFRPKSPADEHSQEFCDLFRDTSYSFSVRRTLLFKLAFLLAPSAAAVLAGKFKRFSTEKILPHGGQREIKHLMPFALCRFRPERTFRYLQGAPNRWHR
jgi:hypothetical protein